MADSRPKRVGTTMADRNARELDDRDDADDIMDLAGQRDDDADARDDLADERDMNAARTGGDEQDFATRTEAASDRLDAKIDRIAARRDRSRMHRLGTIKCAVPECDEPARRGETILGKDIKLTDADGHEFAVPDDTVVSYTAPVCARHSIEDVLDLR